MSFLVCRQLNLLGPTAGIIVGSSELPGSVATSVRLDNGYYWEPKNVTSQQTLTIDLAVVGPAPKIRLITVKYSSSTRFKDVTIDGWTNAPTTPVVQQRTIYTSTVNPATGRIYLNYYLIPLQQVNNHFSCLLYSLSLLIFFLLHPCTCQCICFLSCFSFPFLFLFVLICFKLLWLCVSRLLLCLYRLKHCVLLGHLKV